MEWILFSLLAPVFYAIMTVIDKYAIDKVSKGLYDYMFYFSSVALVVSILVFLFFDFTLNGIGCYSLFGGFLITPATFYYVKAIEENDVSTVAPIFNILPLFLLILSYIFYGTTIHGIQLVAFFIILFGSIIVSTNFKDIEKMKLNSGFYYMILSSFLFALVFFIGDFVIKNTTLIVITFWEGIGAFISMLLLLLIKTGKKEILLGIKDFNLKKIISFLGIVIFDKLGIISTYKAFSLTFSPALVFVIGGVEPFILLIFIIFLTLFFPKIIKENIEKKVLIQKIIGTVIIFVGIYVLYLF